MRLHRLHLVNFRQHRDTDLEFGPGLTGIIGPNGAGKSTLLEAIAWAIYGMDAARGNRDSIRWRRARPRSEVKVELEFGLGAHEYRVVRTLYAAELYLDGATRPMTTSLAEVTLRLTRVLGMSRDEFFNTYFTGQKELAVMAAMKPTERGQFLSRLLGYDKLRLAQERVRARRSSLRTELGAVEASRPDPAALRAARERAAVQLEAAERQEGALAEGFGEAQAARERHAPAFRGLAELRDRHGALVAERRVLEERVRQAVELATRLASEHAAAATAAGERAALLPRLEGHGSLKVELAGMEELARDAARRQTLEAQLAEVALQRGEVERRLAGASAAAGQVRSLAEQLDADKQRQDGIEREYEARQNGWVRERQDAESKRQSLLDQFRDLETQRRRITEAGAEGACPTCGRPLGDEYASVLELLASQLEDVRANGQYFRSRLEQLQGTPPDLAEIDGRRRDAREAVERGAQALAVATSSAEEAVALEKQLRRHDERAARLAGEAARLRPGYDAARHDELRRRATALEPLAARAERLAAEAERAPKLAAELEAAEGRRAAAVEGLAAAAREVARLAYTEDAFQAAAREMQRLEEAVRRSELDLTVARAEASAAADRLRAAEAAEEEAAARAADAARLQVELQLHTELDRALGDLRTELNQEMRPELAALAGEFLGSLTDGRYDEVDLDEDYRITVLEHGEPSPVISGGEEDLTNLVLRLAVSQMIADRSGQPLSLLVLDEIFGSLDDARRAHVLELLRALEGRFPQVVLITHIEAVREAVDRVLRVRFDEGSGAAVVEEERGALALGGGGDADVAA
ncbi:MAG TPA: SMC family ATPase [Gemmatimonadales bacterium]|nr:SMC family ATPase [Gemmatimonadales bacterium]